MITSGFQPNTTVIDQGTLFGHNKPQGLLELLTEKIQIGANTQLLGERRIGKTSVLKCTCNFIRENFPHLIPVYLNFRQYPKIRGYDSAYRFLLAAIHAAFVQISPSYSTASKSLSELGLTASNNIDEHYELLGAANIHEVQRYIEQYVQGLSQAKFGVVLLIDEYESMMINTFEGVKGSFFFIRDLSSQGATVPGSPKPLTYIIAGTTPWIKLCDRIGSPEFNNTGETLYVSPLQRDDFKDMWDHCVEHSSEVIRERIVSARLSLDEVYELSGGWPFFGKIVGQTLGSCGYYDEEAIYQTLSQHFMVSWSRISEDNLQDILLDLSQAKRSTARDLLGRGLIRHISETDSYELFGSLWARYVSEQCEVVRPSKIVTIPADEIVNNLVNNIELQAKQVIDLVVAINETNHNYIMSFIFKPTNNDFQIFDDLRTPAFNRMQFTHFAAGLYLLIFERTIDFNAKQKKDLRLELLPPPFGKEHTFVQEVDAIRHEFAKAHLIHVDTWKPGKNAIPVAEVLEKYLGSRISPSDDQFLQLQSGLLRSLIDYLNDLHLAIQHNLGTHKP